MRAHGQLQHHFWGEYAATITLQFDSAIEAAVARAHVFTDWRTHSQFGEVLVFHGKEPALTGALARLAQHGADMEKVESVAKSIDFGEPFSVEVDGYELAVREGYGQARLEY